MNRTSNHVACRAIDLVTYQHVADIPLRNMTGRGRVINLVPGLWLFPDKDVVDTRYRRRVTLYASIPSHQKESYPASDARGTISAMRFRPENGDVIFADSQGFHV